MSQEVHPSTNTPNIVVFGQTGSGKSSLINMLAGKDVAKVSSLVWGCTTSATAHNITMKNKTYTIWDTSGMNEGEEGSVPAEKAIKDLFDLVKNTSVNLIIYCVRGSRFTDIVRVNFDLFCGIICEGKVPIVIVVTGLEQEENMDEWWRKYEKDVKRLGLAFEGHACVTTIKGKNDIYEKEYQESTDKVWKLVEAHSNSPPWTLSPEWLAKVPDTITRYMAEYNACTGKERKVLPRPRRRTRPSVGIMPTRPTSDPRGSGSSHNIILFGDAGSGKSSIVNMIVGEDVAKVAEDGLRCTFQNECYQARIGDTSFSVYDTCGLNEGEQGRALNWKAVEGLYTLLRQLNGVSLLIYCMRGKVTESSRGNWILFNRVICDEKVPIIAVVTGLDHAEALEDTAAAKGHFEASGMRPKELCCIVSIRGRHNEFEELYRQSQQKLQKLVAESCSRQKWSTGTEDWFGRIYQNVYNTGMCSFPKVQLQFVDAVGNVVDQFIKESDMEAEEARRLKDTLLRAERKLKKKGSLW